MARKPRIEFAGGLYHVIARGNNRQKIFNDARDHRAYLTRLEQYRNRYAVTLYAYMLMPNHVHLLLQTGTPPLSKFMQGLQQSYTLYFNRRHRHVGHLFQGRYRAILCEREGYLLELIRYLHLNPVRARLVRDPKFYPWSSHHAYLGKPGEPPIATGDILNQFANRPEIAVRRYTQFIREGLSWGHREDLYTVLDQRFLGTEQFAASFMRGAGTGEAGERARTPRLSLAQCLDLVSSRLGLEPGTIQSNARLHALVRARRLFSFLACRHAGHPVSAVARFLGVDPSGVTNALHWCERNLSASPDFAGDAEGIIRRGQESSRQFRKV